MSKESKMIFLVGDNPFHGISHLAQERSRTRGKMVTRPDYAANLVLTSIENGADGFMFSVSDTTLLVLRKMREQRTKPVSLYALVPYAYEYIRLATQLGGIPGLANRLAKQIVFSRNVRTIAMGLKGVLRTDPLALMKAYLTYEISRIKSSTGKQGILDSVLLHEVVTDLALALDLDQIFRSYVDFMLSFGIKPGFETRNLPFLVTKLRDWKIDLGKTVIATPLNKIGFQMNPSKRECERALSNLGNANVIAMSVLAAGYLDLPDAMKYIQGLPNLKGIVVGVSKESHALRTFRFLRELAEQKTT